MMLFHSCLILFNIYLMYSDPYSDKKDHDIYSPVDLVLITVTLVGDTRLRNTSAGTFGSNSGRKFRVGMLTGDWRTPC